MALQVNAGRPQILYIVILNTHICVNFFVVFSLITDPRSLTIFISLVSPNIHSVIIYQYIAPIFNMIHRFHNQSLNQDDDDYDDDEAYPRNQDMKIPISEPSSIATHDSNDEPDIGDDMEQMKLSMPPSTNNINIIAKPTTQLAKKRYSSLPASLNGLKPIPATPTKKRDPPARERPLDDKWPERDALSFTRSLVFYGTGSLTVENESACKCIMEARNIRKKYHGSRGTVIAGNDAVDLGIGGDNFDLNCILRDHKDKIGFEFNDDGIVEVGFMGEVGNGLKVEETLISVPNIDEFINDYKRLEVIVSDGAMRSFW